MILIRYGAECYERRRAYTFWEVVNWEPINKRRDIVFRSDYRKNITLLLEKIIAKRCLLRVITLKALEVVTDSTTEELIKFICENKKRIKVKRKEINKLVEKQPEEILEELKIRVIVSAIKA